MMTMTAVTEEDCDDNDYNADDWNKPLRSSFLHLPHFHAAAGVRQHRPTSLGLNPSFLIFTVFACVLYLNCLVLLDPPTACYFNLNLSFPRKI